VRSLNGAGWLLENEGRIKDVSKNYLADTIHRAEQYKNNRAGQQLEMLAFDYLVPRKLICLNLDLDDA